MSFDDRGVVMRLFVGVGGRVGMCVCVCVCVRACVCVCERESVRA